MSKLKKSGVWNFVTSSRKFLYSVEVTNQFKRDVVLCSERGLPLKELREAVCILAEQGMLPEKYKAHKLKGYKENVMECHLRPDWLLVWIQEDNSLTLLFTNTGTHSDIFDR